jgi:hypothetical protein
LLKKEKARNAEVALRLVEEEKKTAFLPKI